jgi:prophage antirepressor-like protein
MSEIITFSFDNVDFHTMEINGELWAVGSDVCKALGLSNPRKAMSRLRDDEKNTVTISDGIPGNPNKTIINEAGIYRLIFTSRAEAAEKFKHWLAHEVLPSIRKTGSYHPAPKPSSAASNDQQELIETLRDKIALLEENRSLVKDRRVSSTFVGVARQLFEKTDFSDDTIAEILAPGIGTRMPEWVTWQRRQHH